MKMSYKLEKKSYFIYSDQDLKSSIYLEYLFQPSLRSWASPVPL